MHIVLENDLLRVKIHPRGAELQSIFHKQFDLEYMWNGDPAHWAKHSPILFPFVGQLKDNTYLYKGKAYSLPRHGFAREMNFESSAVTDTTARFTLRSNDTTRANYPFDFELSILYKIEDNRVQAGYEVTNSGTEEMFFSIGAHPAFAVPLEKGRSFNEYKLVFSDSEHATRWPIQDGMLTMPTPFLKDEQVIKLSHELFYKDALVFKHLNSKTVSLQSSAAPHGLTMLIEGFPYLGIWSATDAPFVCIEPWCGIADSLYHNQQLKEKEGIIRLDAGATWLHGWNVDCW